MESNINRQAIDEAERLVKMLRDDLLLDPRWNELAGSIRLLARIVAPDCAESALTFDEWWGQHRNDDPCFRLKGEEAYVIWRAAQKNARAHLATTQSQTEALRCRFCGSTMRPGKAMVSTWIGGMPDLPGDTHSVTFSPGGPGRMIDCLKCPKCGYSVTVGEQQIGGPVGPAS